jgi:hypothetical protein
MWPGTSCSGRDERRGGRGLTKPCRSDQGAVWSLIGALEAPEAGVAVVAAIGPNERQTEPDALDETCSSGSPHGTALADGTLRDYFGKREMHGNRLPSASLSMRRVRPFIAGGAAPLCAGDILTVRTATVACTVREGTGGSSGCLMKRKTNPCIQRSTNGAKPDSYEKGGKDERDDCGKRDVFAAWSVPSGGEE